MSDFVPDHPVENRSSEKPTKMMSDSMSFDRFGILAKAEVFLRLSHDLNVVPDE
jgi:hypothetical protein